MPPSAEDVMQSWLSARASHKKAREQRQQWPTHLFTPGVNDEHGSSEYEGLDSNENVRAVRSIAEARSTKYYEVSVILLLGF